MWHCVVSLNNRLLISFGKLTHHKIISCFPYWLFIKSLPLHTSTYWNIINLNWWIYWCILYLSFNWSFCCFFSCFFNWGFRGLTLFWILWHLYLFPSSSNWLLIKRIFIASSDRLLIKRILFASTYWLLVKIIIFTSSDRLIIQIIFLSTNWNVVYILGYRCFTLLVRLLALLLFVFVFFHAISKFCWWLLSHFFGLLSFLRKLRKFDFLPTYWKIIWIYYFSFLFNFLYLLCWELCLLAVNVLVLFCFLSKSSWWFF